jgi:perosamine synthetase
MTKHFVPFSKPYFSDDDLNEITEGVKTVLRSGWLTSGPNVEKFEDAFAKRVGSSYGVALNSCTAALHAILVGLGLKSGDEVIVPANAFVATANAALYVGAKPVFADSDPSSFNMSYEDVQNRMTNRTKAIIAVHLGGNPCDMKELTDLAQDHHIFLVEDCAHAHGSKYGKLSCGNIGVAGAFSFYATKVMTACEGGLVTTDDRALADKIRLIRNCGRGGYGPLAISDLGYNYRLSDIHAVIGLSQLRHLDDFIEHRNSIAKSYNELFFNVDWIVPQHVRADNVCSYYAYIVKLDSQAPFSREEMTEKLEENGVMTSTLYHPVHLQPLYLNWFSNCPPKLPVAEELGRNSFAIPLHNGMNNRDVEYVIDVFKSICY